MRTATLYLVKNAVRFHNGSEIPGVWELCVATFDKTEADQTCQQIIDGGLTAIVSTQQITLPKVSP